MSRADHPASRALRCTFDTACTQPPAARVDRGVGYAVVVPPDGLVGDLVCLDHAHTLIDLMLLRATPEPTR